MSRWDWPPLGNLIAGAIAIALLALWIAVDDDAFLRPLDDANLAFHEAGHLFYGLFGEAMGLYGGTLGQLTFPALAATAFWHRRDPVACAIAAAWFGQNLGNIARYAADARAQVLPLVGGGEHDWTNILSRWSALDRDQAVARAFRFGAWVLVLGALAALAWAAWQRREPRRQDI